MEKEIKLLTRRKKEEIIEKGNPEWTFRNEAVLGYWPPTVDDIATVEAFRKMRPDEDSWV